MDTNDNEAKVDAAEEGAEEETPEAELQDNTDWKAEAMKARRIAARYRNKAVKASEAKVEAPAKTEQPADNSLLQKSYLRAAGITHPEDVKLALSTAKKWGVEVDQLIDDEDFKLKLERQQTARSNADATSRIEGDGKGSSAKTDPNYWIAKGAPPTPNDIPDRATRVKIIRAMMAQSKTGGKKFYND